MLEIRSLSFLSQADLYKVIPGYISPSKFTVTTTTDTTETGFVLRFMDLPEPLVKQHDYSDPTILAGYNALVKQGYAYGAFTGENLIGLLLAEIEHWNATLTIREFGVAPSSRNKGVGTALIEKAIVVAQSNNLRSILCETQSTNISAIRFYQKLGFTIQGLDMQLYSNHDAYKDEIAIFLRKPLN